MPYEHAINDSESICHSRHVRPVTEESGDVLPYETSNIVRFLSRHREVFPRRGDVSVARLLIQLSTHPTEHGLVGRDLSNPFVGLYAR